MLKASQTVASAEQGHCGDDKKHSGKNFHGRGLVGLMLQGGLPVLKDGCRFCETCRVMVFGSGKYDEHSAQLPDC